MRPISATLSLAALVGNLAVVRRHAPRSRAWAVVKADAYGHGLLRLLPALQQADGLALLELEMALALRQAGYAGPVLLLEGYFTPDELPVFAQSRFTAVVHCLDQVQMLERAKLASPVDVYVKFNTGMNRLGFSPQDAGAVLPRLSACANTGRMTLMTHFADADGVRGVVNAMDCVARLEQAVAAVTTDTAGVQRIYGRSYANSAAILRFPDTHADWVRPGIMLYGCTPFGDEPVQPAEQFGLKPVMTLKSRIIAVQELRAGNRIGYGGSYTAPAAMRVGIVACGYADGYPRHAPGSTEQGTPLLVNGRRTRTVGRVSMDMLYADLTAMPDAGVGSEVTLWGEGLSADEVAAAAGTVSYELLCALSRRVPVEVIGPGQQTR
jgi:alanine racemase